MRLDDVAISIETGNYFKFQILYMKLNFMSDIKNNFLQIFL